MFIRSIFLSNKLCIRKSLGAQYESKEKLHSRFEWFSGSSTSQINNFLRRFVITARQLTNLSWNDRERYIFSVTMSNEFNLFVNSRKTK